MKKTQSYIDESFSYISSELSESKKAEKKLSKIQKKAKRQKEDYKLTNPQLNFLNKLKKKYDKGLVKEIKEFRNNVLAPLHYVHKKTREQGLVSAKDLVGLTKKDWERAVESGKNKIKRRGELKGKIAKDINSVEYNKRAIKKLESIKRMLSGKNKVNPKLIKSEIDRFIKKTGFLGGAEVNNIKSVQQYNNDIEKSWDNIQKELESGDVNSEYIAKEARNILVKQHGYKDTESGGISYSDELNKAASNLFFRDKVINKILSADENVFKTFYYNFLDELIKKARRRINEHVENLRRRRSDLEFNKNERKVWGVNKNAHPLSGDEDDYYLKIKEEDFSDAGKETSIEQPEDMKSAKKKIENERYNFFQRLKKKYEISTEDFEKLQSLGITSFIDRKKMTDLALKKLSGKFSEKQIKNKVNSLIDRSSSEKEVEDRINSLAGKSIDKENMYDKAYKIFSGENISRGEIKKITDQIIKKSKNEKEVENRLESLLKEKKKNKSSIETLKREIIGNSEDDE